MCYGKSYDMLCHQLELGPRQMRPRHHAPKHAVTVTRNITFTLYMTEGGKEGRGEGGSTKYVDIYVLRGSTNNGVTPFTSLIN